MAMSYTMLTASKTTAGSIARWVNNDTIDSAQTLIEAEQWIWRRLRVREMITYDDATMSTGSGNQEITLPTTYLEPVWLGYRGLYGGEIELRDIAELQTYRSFDSSGNLSTGQPFMYTIHGSILELSMEPDAAYTYRHVYFEQLPELSGSNETNFLTDRAPRLLRNACMAFAKEFLKEEEDRQYHLQLAMDEINTMNQEYDLQMTASGLVMSPE